DSPVSISGKTGTAEKYIDPGDGYMHTFNQSWWCGYGPSDSPDLVVCALIENGGQRAGAGPPDSPAFVVCALIENGGHGGDAAAPAALRVFEEFFGKQATQKGPIH